MKRMTSKFEVTSIKVNKLKPDGLSFRYLEIGLRNADTGEAARDTTPMGLKADGRWYFYELR